MTPRKTRQQHEKQGTFNATRNNRGQLERGIPPMPADLAESAAAFWKPLTAMLDRAGLLTEIDGTACRLLCETLVVRREALDSIAALGVLVDGYRGSKVKNPAIAVYLNTTSVALALLKQLGLTPRSREGMSVAPAPEVDAELERILGFSLKTGAAG